MGRLTPLPFWPPRSFLVGKVSLTSRMRNMWSLSCIWAGLRLSFHLSFCYGISVHRGWTPFAQPGTQISPASPPPYVCMCVCVCVCARAHACTLSRVWLLAVPWTVPCQARLLCPWDFPGKILEWVAISWPRDWTCVSGVSLCWHADSLPLCHLGSLTITELLV